MPAVYALLVGINNYPVKPLSGCINDVNAMEEYLGKMYGNRSDITLNIMRITDEDPVSPTRANIISGFDHFADAGEEDTCFFYYSGHGSFSPAPKEFWTEADLRSESFVCIDSRLPGGKDLMDKEVGYLIWKTMNTRTKTRFVIITDCCHCGTITRDIDDSGITDRMMPDAIETPRFEDYLGYKTSLNGESYFQLTADGTTGKDKVSFRQGKHIHLAASRENQTAKELNIDGVKRGAFTHSLLKILYSSEGRVSYRDLVNKTAILIKNLVSDQNPGLHVNGSENKSESDDLFLTRVNAGANTFLVYYDARWQWCIKGGLIHGISTGDELIIDGVGSTVVTGNPAPDFSTIAALPAMSVTTEIYESKIVHQPNQPLAVSFDPLFKHKLRDSFEKLLSENAGIAFKLTTESSGRFIIRNDGDFIFITKPGSMTPLMKPVEVLTVQDGLFVIERIIIINKWMLLLELNQSSFSRKPYDLELYRNTRAGDYDAASFVKVELNDPLADYYYQEDDAGEWHQPAFKLLIRNTGQVPLFVSNAYLAFDYAITTEFFEEIELLAPGNEVWLTFVNEEAQQDTILLNVDEKYSKLGYMEIGEYLKVFVATQQISTDKLAQDGIEMPMIRHRAIDEKSPSPVGAKKSVGAFNWAVETFGFRIVRPAGKSDIAPNEPTTLQSVIIAPHKQLRAKAALVSSATTQRSFGSIPPPHAAMQNSYLEPFDFTAGSRSSNHLDILELSEVENATSVNETSPLVLSIAADTRDVIPVGYDPVTELYFPVGFSNTKGELIIETLPEPTPVDTAINAKSLVGSIKIYFQKIIGQKLGIKYDYPRLAITSVGNDLSVIAQSEVSLVSEVVAGAQNILLFVHGIIGDSESIVKCVRTKLASGSLSQKADLILSFDYENLQTTIEENAALLKERLAAVGLSSNNNKNLIIVAHSMGGLVSRWFIEKLGGNLVAKKLVMLGTPNNGTPWADVRDMAETLLTYAINGAAFLKPWMFALNIAGKITGGTQVTLKQMDKDTGIYKLLNDGTDPGIPYIIIAGDTKQIVPDYDKTATLLARIFTRIKKRGLYDTLDLALFKEANDIAVTDKSIIQCGTSSAWKIQPKLIYVASDHMNYFNNKVALENIMA